MILLFVNLSNKINILEGVLKLPDKKFKINTFIGLFNGVITIKFDFNFFKMYNMQFVKETTTVWLYVYVFPIY